MHPSLSCDLSAAGHSIDHGRLTIQNYTGRPPAKQANSRHHPPPGAITLRGADLPGERETSPFNACSGQGKGVVRGRRTYRKRPRLARRASVPARLSTGTGMPTGLNVALAAGGRSGKTRFPRAIPRICFISAAQGGMIDPEGGICLKQVPLSGMIRPVPRRMDIGGLGLAELIGNGGQHLGEQG